MAGAPSEGRCITASPLSGGVVSAGSESDRQRGPLRVACKTGPQGRMSTRNVRDACRTGLRGRQRERYPQYALSAVVALVAVSPGARSAVSAVRIARFCTNGSGLGLPLRNLISSVTDGVAIESCT
eukprot:IDg20585t1